jgi:hypothetical protein
LQDSRASLSLACQDKSSAAAPMTLSSSTNTKNEDFAGNHTALPPLALGDPNDAVIVLLSCPPRAAGSNIKFNEDER